MIWERHKIESGSKPGQGWSPSKWRWRERRRSRIAAAIGLFALLVATSAVFLDSAGAAPPCAVPQTTSADGTVVTGSPCSDQIVVTSPLVRKIYGGEGDDVIYANPNVEEIVGGEGNDVIYGELPESEAAVEGGEGPVYEASPEANDATTTKAPSAPESRLLRRTNRRQAAAPQAQATASNLVECTTNPCYGGLGNQIMKGGEGNDKIFGQRGDDTIFGEGGDDALYGGIGDDEVFGNAGNDLVTGGYGTDKVDGGNGSDLVRGDATTDTLMDRGGSGTDTVSFATAVAPGFHGAVGVAGFPADSDSEERGVSVALDGSGGCPGFDACNNSARYGGGNDTIEANAFENVIGSPFADLIVGSSAANRIDGGGGTDVIIGRGGDDTLYGGAEADYIEGGEGNDTAFGQAGTNNCAADVESRNECSGTAASVTQRDRTKITAGYMVSPLPGNLNWTELYVVGSTARDDLLAAYRVEKSGQAYVTFSALSDSVGRIDLSGNANTGNCTYVDASVQCALPRPPDAVLMAGMGGDDRLIVSGFEITASPILLGGEGNDVIEAGPQEDVLVDGNGAGNDTLIARGSDDALINNEGTDSLQGGNGNDLLVSVSACDGDTLQGAEGTSGDGSAQNNASWAQLLGGSGGMVADLEAGTAGSSLSNGKPACASGTPDVLRNIDDLEGSNEDDALYGDANGNSLFGRPGKDGLFARAGEDFIEAIDGQHDDLGGGSGTDTCNYDKEVDSRESCEKGEGK